MMSLEPATAATTANLAPLPTASAWLAVLQEDNAALQEHALLRLLECVDAQWHEIAQALPDLEALAEQGGGAANNDKSAALAAAVASKVFFYLEEHTTALRLALLAGDDSTAFLTDKDSASPYAVTLIRAALDAYIAAQRLRRQTSELATSSSVVKEQPSPPTLLSVEQLQPLIHRLLESACVAGNHSHAIGIALEAGEVSQLELILQHAAATVSSTRDVLPLLKYAVKALEEEGDNVINDKAFRVQALQIIATHLQRLFDDGESSSSSSSHLRLTVSLELVHIWQRLNDATRVATVLSTLLRLAHTEEEAGLTALQLTFDLQDSGDQAFVQHVADALAPNRPTTTSSEDDASSSSSSLLYWDKAFSVLTGGFASDLALSFLHKQSGADHRIMDTLKKQLEERSSGSSRSSVLHNAAVVTHSYLYAGTTNDAFLRQHLDWMKKASNWYVCFFFVLKTKLAEQHDVTDWNSKLFGITILTLAAFCTRAKFTATASLGVIHSAHITQAMQLLEPYLPADPLEAAGVVSPAGGYAEGGSLYALGLIHGSGASCAEKRHETAEYLRKHLRASHANEVISHGAALAVGLACMGSADLAVVHELKEVLDTDFAVAGEAAGVAIGMVLVGTGAGNTHNSLPASADKEEIMEVVAELKNYARETQHEKIIRGIAMGLAIMNFGQEENADAVIEEMRGDRDPILRYGAQYATALAYCGTGSNKAIGTLLHTAVSDVSDDVRMAAVIGLAFVLFKTPERVPQLVKLLLESFNPHVRYASCMAVGIAMAGTGDAESVALLEPMLEDMTDFVRQGALMGTAMTYMQQSDSANGRKIRTFREKLMTLVSEKHQSTLTKMGAIMAMGIMDAGGRNCSLQLGSRNGFTKMTSAVGLALWLQHWHWYPMMHMFSLALTPTLTIGLNKNFNYPKNFEIICHAKPSQFAYPKKLQEKKEKEKKRVETVTLSTTAKEKARLARKKAKMGEKDDATMDVEEEKKPTDEDLDEKSSDAMDIDKEGDEEAEKKAKKKREPEPTSFTVKNPARITKVQSLVCQFDLSQRYRPVRPDEKPFGVILLTDTTPEVEEDLGAVKPPSLEPEGELAPPESFEWTPPPRSTNSTE